MPASAASRNRILRSSGYGSARAREGSVASAWSVSAGIPDAVDCETSGVVGDGGATVGGTTVGRPSPAPELIADDFTPSTSTLGSWDADWVGSWSAVRGAVLAGRPVEILGSSSESTGDGDVLSSAGVGSAGSVVTGGSDDTRRSVGSTGGVSTVLGNSVNGDGDVDSSAGEDGRSLEEGAVLTSVSLGEGGGLVVSTVGLVDSVAEPVPEPEGEPDDVSGALDPIGSLEPVVVVARPLPAATAELRTSPAGARSNAMTATATADRTATAARRYANPRVVPECHAMLPVCRPMPATVPPVGETTLPRMPTPAENYRV